jgi:hypothetical protein
MYSLFLLLFRKSYWRMLLRKATWIEAWLSLTRAHKDRRARRHLGRLSLMLVVPVLCMAYAFWLIGSGAWIILPLLAPILWWQNRRRNEDQVPVRITPGPEPLVRPMTARERELLRLYFAELTVLYAVMVARAGSEGFLKEKTLPEGFEVTSRRTYLDLLKSAGLWDRMARVDREAMMMPDGHWGWARINQVALGLEPLRLLRWMLQIDFYLPLVGQQLKGDYAIAYELVQVTEKVLGGKDLAELEAVRVGMESAEVFFHRCLAEGISRGYYEVETEEAVAWATRVSTNLRGRQHEDFVLGGKLVSEASRDELLWAVSLSRRRTGFLKWVVEVMEAGKAPEGEFFAVCLEAEELAS